MQEFYAKWFQHHTDEANKYLMTDIKKYMFHVGEAGNYKKMLESTSK